MNALRVRDPRDAGRYIREVEKRTAADAMARDAVRHLSPESLRPVESAEAADYARA